MRLSLTGRALVVLVALVALGWLIDALAPILTPFLFGAILAYIGAPIMNALEQRGVGRTLGALLVIAALVGFLIALVLVVAPLIASEVNRIARALPDIVNRAQTVWIPWLNATFGLALALDLSALRTLASEHTDVLGPLSQRFLGSLKVGGQALLGIALNVTLVPVVMFYLLRDWPRLIAGVDGLVPAGSRATVRTLAREIDAVLSEFLRGQGLVMLALAAYYSIALWLVGLDYALAVGLVTGLLVFIPYLGFGLGLALGMLAALTQFTTPGPIIAVALVFAGGQLLEGFVLVPNLVGDRIGLHPLAVIFALMAFGQLFGFVGVLLALPASAALLVIARHVLARLRETAPTAPPAVPPAAPPAPPSA
jgi:predicted PurR-regulated permease PerM